QRRDALRALVACPTASIGTAEKHDLAPVIAGFPEPIEDEVRYCGFHHEASYGAASYLILRPEGNVLVDSPRFTAPLVRNIEALGGVRWMFLTHRDDVADHRKFRARFGCERVLHRGDVTRGTADVERKIEGDAPEALAEDLLVIPTPGHTRGSACLLYREKFLFSGDHVAWSGRRGRVVAFKDACWYDWDAQRASMRRLAAFRFERILPGHGRRCAFPAEEMRGRILACAAWMEKERPARGAVA
ncbi:MAG: MBL fold metallo-hydrolase, partial [Candidatus Methylomirabilis sp.]|nr:MBL fold metallo-hydrolase [Deltaproteobacteria bacterium]